LEITTQMIKELRERSGAGVMECRTILVDTGGDLEKALEALRQKGLLKAQKKAERATGQGLVEAYVHTAGRLAAMVEVNCETDFVARTDVFKDLAHSLAMQVAALSPKYVSKGEMPADETAEPGEVCLLLQPYIKDPARTINDIVVEAIAKTGENIRVRRFVRFELGC
jgi:elongation factor Ts